MLKYIISLYKHIDSSFFKILMNFLNKLFVTNTRSVSLIGLFLLILILFQCITGIMISFSLISEPMLIPTSRDEEDSDDLYTDDFF